MKIALTFPGCHRRGGVERIMLECANFLARQGHQIYIVAQEIDTTVLEADIVPRLVAKHSGVFRPLLFARDADLELRNIKPDALCSFGAICPAGGVNWVQSVHRRWIEISGKTRNLSGRMKQLVNPFHPIALWKEQEYFGKRQYKKLLALTPDVAQDLKNFYAVPDSDIELMPNGYRPEEFNPGTTSHLRSAVRQELGYTASDKVLVFVANELERKGFGPLIKALDLLKNPQLKLLVVGRVDYSPYIGDLEKFGMRDRVNFIGSSSDVSRFYAASDLFVLPTKYEAWGLVITEALACGLPVVTSKIAGAAISINEGRNGYLISDPTDFSEIAELIQLGLSLETDRESISVSVQEYSWDNVLKRYEQIILECFA